MRQTIRSLFVKALALFAALPLVACSVNAAWVDAATDNAVTKQGNQSTGQVLDDANGNEFMEEVPTPRPRQQQGAQEKPVPDLSTVGVPVDPHGDIVPLINKSAGPVLPFYSQFETSVEPLWQFAPVYPYGYPAYPGAYPMRSPFPLYSYYGRPGPYIWSYHCSSRVGFLNLTQSNTSNLYSINPWFTPPPVPPPGF